MYVSNEHIFSVNLSLKWWKAILLSCQFKHLESKASIFLDGALRAYSLIKSLLVVLSISSALS